MLDFSADMDVFFGDEFAEGVMVKIGTADAFTIRAIFDTRPPFTATNFKGFRGTDDFGQGGVSVAGAMPRLIMPTADAPDIKPSVMRTTRITVRGKDYEPSRITPDGTGVTMIELMVV